MRPPAWVVFDDLVSELSTNSWFLSGCAGSPHSRSVLVDNSHFDGVQNASEFCLQLPQRADSVSEISRVAQVGMAEDGLQRCLDAGLRLLQLAISHIPRYDDRGIW